MTDHRDGPSANPPPVRTTELDWVEQARRDGWRRTDGAWQHDDRPDAYDEDDWVYLGDGVWEDVSIASLTPRDRREVLTRYDQLRTEILDRQAQAGSVRPAGRGRIE